MNTKTQELRTLKQNHDKELKRFYALKTKKAQQRSRDKMREIIHEISTCLDLIVPKKLELVSELLCSPMSGGGAGIPKGQSIEVQHTFYNMTFYCNGYVYRADLYSQGWSKSAFETILSSIEAA